MNFYFWINYLNPHQTPFFDALASAPGNKVTLIPQTAMIAKRVLTKWIAPELNQVNVILNPDDSKIRHIIHQSGKDAMHIFHGMHYPVHVPKALQVAKENKSRIAIWSEPYYNSGLKGKFRYLQSIYHRIKHDKSIDILLATGNQGVEFLQKAGHPENKIFQWGYFTETPTCEAQPLTATFNIGFAGFLIHRKGVDHLLQAIAKIDHNNICLTILGEGPHKKVLDKLVAAHSLKCVRFRSFINTAEVNRFMAMQDLFILPSRFDGWGAVVNEALMQGTPVICSDNCGASVLLSSENNSSTYKTGSVDALASLIEGRINRGKLKDKERNKIIEWSSCISGESAASYFRNIIDHVYHKQDRPSPPWQKNTNPKFETDKVREELFMPISI